MNFPVQIQVILEHRQCLLLVRLCFYENKIVYRLSNERKKKKLNDIVDRLISFRGGVLTPGIAFARTSLKDYLEKNGITFAEK